MGATKGLVAAVKRVVTPGQHLTQEPGPRVLIQRFGETFGVVNGRQTVVHSEADELAERLRQSGVPTVSVAPWLPGEHNLNEWDCLITTDGPARFESRTVQDSPYDEPYSLYTWKQQYPDHLCILRIVKPSESDMLDFDPPEATEQRMLPTAALVCQADLTGKHLRKAEGLPESLAALVMRDLVPVVKGRTKHLGFMWGALNDDKKDPDARERLRLTPFLYGPDDVILAGSYQRSESASTWLIPSDVPDIHPWAVEALREWRDLYPDRFPALPDWQEGADWRTAAEVAIDEAKRAHADTFRAAYERFIEEQMVFEEEGAEAKKAADSYQRALLREDGPALERAVEQAIGALGFRVVNMDQVHPDGDRREDLRVYDDGDPDWVAIVEIKGGKGGAKENELHLVGKWATRFAVDEGRAPSAQWFVVNHQRFTDPSGRPVPFGGKPAVAETFAQVDGSIIDTRALFDLLRLVEGNPDLAPQARALLKAKPPILTRVKSGDLSNDKLD